MKTTDSKQLLKRILIVVVSFGMLQIVSAQDTLKTNKSKLKKRSIRKAPIKNKRSVRVVDPRKDKKAQAEKQPEKQQTKLSGNNLPKAIDREMMNWVLSVSQKYEKTLRDPQIFVDERGYHQMTFDIIKKEDGNFALVYGAATENLDIYSKGILFTLRPNLSQKGSAMIITKYDEELRYVKLKEFHNGILSIAYTCNDNRCVSSNGSRNNKLSVLKYVKVDANNHVESRNIDDTVGEIQLKGMFQPSSSSDITVAYNLNGVGKLGLASAYLGSHNTTCKLRKLSKIETIFYGQPPTRINPKIKSVSLINNKFLILNDKQIKTPVWDLADEGLTSQIVNRDVWPLLVVDAFGVASCSNKGFSSYDNDPYTIYSDTDLELSNITNTIPLSDGSLGVLEQIGKFTYFNVFDSKLKRLQQHIELAENIYAPSIQSHEVGNNQILFFYKTKSGSDTVEYRATIYDWKKHEILWNGSEILWTSIEDFSWMKKHKLVRIDDNLFVVVSFAQDDTRYKHEQVLEYRTISLNLN